MTQAFLQASKLNLKDVNYVAPYHIATKWQSWIWIQNKFEVFILSAVTHYFLLCIPILPQDK